MTPYSVIARMELLFTAIGSEPLLAAQAVAMAMAAYMDVSCVDRGEVLQDLLVLQYPL